MTSLARHGARLLAATLAVTLLPALALAQDAAPTVHPWKTAYAKRLAEERLEHKRARKEREDGLRRLARQMRKHGRSTLRTRGESVRPARPDAFPEMAGEPVALRRTSRPFASQAFTPPSNRLVNDRAGDAADAGQSEQSLAAFGDKMVAAWNDGQGFQTLSDRQGWATSTDGGITWVDHGTVPKPAGVTNFVWTSDPVVTLNEKTGAFYYTGLCDFTNLVGDRSGVAVVKGRFNGNVFTWETPVITNDVDVFTDQIDKEWIVADSVSGRVYLSYTRFPFGLSRIEFQRADSSLAAFSTPQLISLDVATENGWVQGSRPIVDGDGVLYVMYYLIGQGELDFYRVLRSNDGGLSFGAPVTAVSAYTNFGTGAPGFNRDMGVQFASIAVDRSRGVNRGRLYLSWAESIDWLDDVFSIGGSGSKSETEPDDLPGNAVPATVGQTLRGTVSTFGDVDLYALTLTAGQHLIVAADSCQAGPVLTLRLLAGDGNTRLTFTTFNSGVNPTVQNPQGIPSGWLFTAPLSGTYYVRVNSRAGIGSYRLRTGFADRTTERGRDQRDVFVSHSDNGATWSTPVSLSNDPVGLDAFLPELAVTPDGSVYCIWFDFRDATIATDGGESSVYVARSGDGGTTFTTLGAVTDTLSRWSVIPSNIEPNQGDYLALFANGQFVWPCWADARRGDPDVFVARIPLLDIRLARLRLATRRVDLDWRVSPADTLTMRLYRADDGGAFQYRDVVQFDATGALAYSDTTVLGDHAYLYHLGRFTDGIERFTEDVPVFLPSSFGLSLATPFPNPVPGNAFTVDLSLLTDAPAELILHDIAGREVYRQRIALNRGTHRLTLPVSHDLKQGLYVLTLRQGGHNASTRVHLVR